MMTTRELRQMLTAVEAVENDESRVMHRDENGYEYMEGRKVK